MMMMMMMMMMIDDLYIPVCLISYMHVIFYKYMSDNLRIYGCWCWL